MQLNLKDLDGLHDLADDIEEHPRRHESPHGIAAAIRRELQRLRVLILAES